MLSISFGNSADFSASVTIEAGNSKIEPGITPATNVVISWPRLIDTADDAGWSRRWGGIHVPTSDEHGRGLGRRIGSNGWIKAQAYYNGTASQPTEPRHTIETATARAPRDPGGYASGGRVAPGFDPSGT